MCGGGGVILEESVSSPRMHVGLPSVNPPCICVFVDGVWVRALFLSLVLIKEAFELVSKTTTQFLGWEVHTDWRVLNIYSSACHKQFVRRNASAMGLNAPKYGFTGHAKLIMDGNSGRGWYVLKHTETLWPCSLSIDNPAAREQANIYTHIRALMCVYRFVCAVALSAPSLSEIVLVTHNTLHQIWPFDQKCLLMSQFF